MSTNTRPTKPAFDDLISQAEAARIRGISRQAVGRLISRGRLKTYEIGGIKFVSRTEVLNFMPVSVGRKAAK